MGKADALLAACRKVKRTGNGTWLACCPAHQDRNPSMSVREADDGRVLVHCHAGCSFESICSAAGITPADLMPEALADHLAPMRARWPARDVLEAVAREVMIARVCAAQLAKGEPLSAQDTQRLTLATRRLSEAVDAVRGD